MTREQKLALIIGFALVLLVGVLISDHLSRARQARIASVGGAEAPAPALNQPSPRDPLKGLETALNTPTSATPNNPAPGPTVSGPSMPPQPQLAESTPPPATIAQGGTAHPAQDDTPLREAVEKFGGQITLLGKDKIPTIILPEAAKSAPVNIATLPATSTLQTMPMFGYAAPSKTLGTNEQVKLHAVQKGETMFQIAAKYYGTGHVWQQLAAFNGVTNKDGVVRVGTRLKIPTKDALLGRPAPVETAGRTPSSTPTDKVIPARRQDMPVVKPEVKLATYTVRKGETLGEISKKVLGSSKRWQELAEFNELEDEDNVAAGTVLKVPPMRG